MSLRVVRSIGIVTVQDRGRPGHMHEGLPPGGALVPEYLDRANSRVGNAPDAAAIEEVFFGRNITTAISVGQARGVLILALANAGLPVAEYSPPQVKDAVTGYGKADKHQVQLMVRNLLRLDETPRPDDAADGLAVALTHYQHSRFTNLVSLESRES